MGHIRKLPRVSLFLFLTKRPSGISWHFMIRCTGVRVQTMLLRASMYFSYPENSIYHSNSRPRVLSTPFSKCLPVVQRVYGLDLQLGTPLDTNV